MERCIYCWNILDYKNKSKEHIVPWAIGGSNSFVTNYCCKNCNNNLGSTVDAKFSNCLPIAIERQQLKIPGHSGNIPSIIFELKSENNGNIGKITIDSNGNIDISQDVTVVDEKHENYERRLIGGDPEKVKKILEGMIKSAQKKNKTIYDENRDVVESWEDIIKTAKIEETDTFSGNIVALDFQAWNRGMFKIALGLGHSVLGDIWTFSSEADRLRTVISLPRENWPTFMGINPPIPVEIDQFFGIDSMVKKNKEHTLVVLPNDKPMALISLFGGFVPKFAISLGDSLGTLGVIEKIDPSKTLGFRINPTSRTVTKITALDLCRFRCLHLKSV
ncbi:HNH endonuclease [Acetobacter orientalis]|uniref:HNH endonuclease n=1 Tax=Acetobacter orientalis TaxID=146474 RepID=UPI0039EB474A